jgi:hypothetical protein
MKNHPIIIASLKWTLLLRKLNRGPIVIPEKTGIQAQTGCRIKTGMTAALYLIAGFIALFLSTQIVIGQAMGAARDETLAPGKNAKKVEWIQVPFADPFHLIVCSKSVQKELGVTRRQLSQFREMEPLFRSELRELSYRKDQQSENEIHQHIEAARNGLGRILDPVQLKRLRQLLLQLHGPCSVAKDPNLAALLKITDEQSRKIDSILDALRTNSGRMDTVKREDDSAATNSPVPDGSAKRRQMQQLLRSLNSEVYKLFSDEQKRIYAKAEGQPFEFNFKEAPACLEDDEQPK